ncbi:MAG: haloacid dehalogenase-like hydrolase [Prevotella sp.]|nr:haloacid dehalogenase-like hydrolase [Prevotella sp.]
MGNICNSFTTSSRKIITLIFFAIMLAIIGICYFTLLDEVAFSKKDWDKDVYKSLNALIVDHAGKNDYAVFDFDKTTIVHDVSNALLVYQVENLKFADAPSHSFLDGIDDKDAILKGAGISSREMGDTLKAEYNRMKARLSNGESLDSIRVSDDYLDFRARFISFMDALGKTFPEEVWYAWMPGLLTGMTTEEAKELISEAIDDQLGEDKLAVEEWTSPDGRWGGPVEKGIFLPEEMKDLYAALNDNGIDTYICSASLELIVETLACDSVRGLALSPERVYGLRFVDSPRIVAKYDSEYKQPIKEGKVECIKTYIAPQYGDRGPVLVGGDSNGDVPMLTSFDDTRASLIIDVKRNPESSIGQLAAKAKSEDNEGRYLLQPAFAKSKGDIEFEGI